MAFWSKPTAEQIAQHEAEERDIAERHARGEKCIPGDWDCACCGLADPIADGLCRQCWIQWIGLFLVAS